MAINFPDAPTIGDAYTDATSGITYTWDGTRWAGNVSQTPTSPDYVLVAGDTMTGPLNVPAGATTTQAPQVQEVVLKTGDTMSGGLKVEAVTNAFIDIESYGMAPDKYPGFRVKGERADDPGNDREMEFAMHSDATTSILTPFLRMDSTNGGKSYYFRGNDGNFRSFNAVPKYNEGTVVGDQTSDERLKQNIVDYTSGLDVVLQLEPKQYEYIQSPETRHAGFIAQQVQGLIPEAVYSTGELREQDPEPYLAMSYVEIIPALVNSIKELQAQIADLKGGN